MSGSSARHQTIPRTLCFITCGERILLLKGAANKRIWPNLYNGVGGHVERHEDVLSAALREVYEETGLTIKRLSLCGVIHVDVGRAQPGVMVFVFVGESCDQQVRASLEGELEWLAIDDVLDKKYNLVEDLYFLLPRALATHTDAAQPLFFARYYYDQNQQLLAEFNPACQI